MDKYHITTLINFVLNANFKFKFKYWILKGYEDVLRHRSDREVNNIPVRILRNGIFTSLKWKDIHVS